MKKRDNIGILERSIQKSILKGNFSQGEGAVVSNARHKEALDKAFVSMLSVKKAIEDKAAFEIVAIDLREAIYNLGSIVGKSVSDDILDRIFSQFCIGK